MWLGLFTGGFLLLLAVILLSNVEISVWAVRHQEAENLLIKIRLLFGMIRFRLRVPVVKLNLMNQSVSIKSEESLQIGFEASSSQGNSLSFQRIIDYFKRLKDAIAHMFGFADWLRGTLSKAHCTKVKWHTWIGAGDAPTTAIATGTVWGLKTGILSYAFHFMHLDAKPQIAVNPQFNSLRLFTEFEGTFHIRMIYVMKSGLMLLRRMMKSQGGFRFWKRTLFKPGGSTS